MIYNRICKLHILRLFYRSTRRKTPVSTTGQSSGSGFFTWNIYFRRFLWVFLTGKSDFTQAFEWQSRSKSLGKCRISVRRISFFKFFVVIIKTLRAVYVSSMKKKNRYTCTKSNGWWWWKCDQFLWRSNFFLNFVVFLGFLSWLFHMEKSVSYSKLQVHSFVIP